MKDLEELNNFFDEDDKENIRCRYCLNKYCISLFKWLWALFCLGLPVIIGVVTFLPVWLGSENGVGEWFASSGGLIVGISVLVFLKLKQLNGHIENLTLGPPKLVKTYIEPLGSKLNKLNTAYTVATIIGTIIWAFGAFIL